MVLHFPSKLTEEEEQLQSKYAKLRRKKKQLQDVSKPKQEPEHNKIKKPSEAKDAKEVAKKLLKTGAIKAIKKSLEKEKAKDEKNIGGFKRSKGLERKLNGMDRALSSYQPFSATHGPGGGFDTGGEDFEPEIPEALVCLDWYNSDLNLRITDNYMTGIPFSRDGWGYCYAGARATYGFNSGKVWFEVNLNSLMHAGGSALKSVITYM